MRMVDKAIMPISNTYYIQNTIAHPHITECNDRHSTSNYINY